MYSTALQIMNYTSTGCFYERYALEMIATYSGLQKDSLPPIADVTFGQKERKWTVQESKEQLDSVMTQMITLLKAANTSNDYLPEINESGEYRDTTIGVHERTVFYPINEYKDIEVHHFYRPWWTTYLDITPKQGNTIGPSNELGSDSGDMIGQLMSALSYKEYFSNYRYSFPVLVELKFKDEQDNPKVFRYAQEANLIGTVLLLSSL